MNDPLGSKVWFSFNRGTSLLILSAACAVFATHRCPAADDVREPPSPEAARPPVTAELVGVKEIWGRAPHNAFTDLVRWQGRFYCAFREGRGHAGDNGQLRVIVSGGGERWESAAQLRVAGRDLRDAALSVTPGGQLLVLGGIQHVTDGVRRTGTVASFSRDGKSFSKPEIIFPPGRWLWRVTWHEGTAYGVSYPTPDGAPFTALHASTDGKSYKTLVPKLLGAGGRPTEARLRFSPGGTAYCLHRRDGKANTAFFGSAKPPYTEWKWADLKIRIGGPNFLQVPRRRGPGEHWIAAGRLYDGGPRTELLYLDVNQGEATPILRLPSGGDTSYPGMVWHQGLLWVSYYASHEKKAKIYLAKVRLRPRPKRDR